LFELNTIGFPLFVKTLHEGTSKGITQSSRVENFEQLKDPGRAYLPNYKQPALVEEFIKGTEFTVAVIGNNPPWPCRWCNTRSRARRPWAMNFIRTAMWLKNWWNISARHPLTKNWPSLAGIGGAGLQVG
jgi:hypothetical protein